MIWVYLTTGNGKLRDDPTTAVTNKNLMELYFLYYVKIWDQIPKTNASKKLILIIQNDNLQKI